MGTQKLRVLLVDGKTDSPQQLAEFLRHDYAYKVEIAVSYEEATTLAADPLSPYHVVVIDEKIPFFEGQEAELCGIDLVRGIKRYHPRTGFIIWRGEEMGYSLEAALEVGAFRYLAPSVNWKELGTLIRYAAQHQQLKDDARTKGIMEALRETVLNITSFTDHTELLNTIVEQAVKLLKAQNGGLYRYYPEKPKEQLEIIAHYKRPEALRRILDLGEGLVGEMVQQGNHIYRSISDYNAWPQRVERFTDEQKNRSMFCVLLKWHEEIIGALYVNDIPGRQFDENEIRLLSMFADHAAIALNNYDLVEQNAGKLDRLERLSRATREIMESLGTAALDAHLQMIAKHATELLDAEVCRVFLVTRPDWLSARASYGDVEGRFEQEEEYPIRSAHGGGLTSHIAYKGEIFNAYGDELAQNLFSDGDRPNNLPSVKRHSLLAIPLKHGDKLIGLLRIENKKSRDGSASPYIGFTDEDVWLLSIFAETVVTAIQNAKIVRKQALFIQAIDTVSSTGNPSDGLQKLTEMIPLLFDHTFCKVFLKDGERQSLKVKAAHIKSHNGHQPSWDPGSNKTYNISAWKDLDILLKKDRPTVLSINKKHQEHELQKFSDDLNLPQPIQYLLMIPLKTEGEVVGLLQIGELRSEEKYGFTQEQQILLATVATRITPLVNLMRLQEIAEHQKKAATVIAQVTAQEDHDVMHAIVRGTMEAVECDAVTLYEYDHTTNKLSYPPATAGVRYPEKLRWFPDVTSNPLLHKMCFRDEPYCVSDVTKEPLFQHSHFSREEAIQSCIAIPLKAAGERVGVMFVNYRTSYKFTDTAVANFHLFADQAAVAIRNAQLYKREKKRAAARNALRKAMHGVDRSLDLVLDHIAEQAWHATNTSDYQNGFADIWLVKNMIAKLATAFPKEVLEKKRQGLFQQGLGPDVVYDDGRIGIIGRAIRTREPQFVEDVSQDKDYLVSYEATRSEGIVPIVIDGGIVGLINVEYFYPKTFDEEDKHVLETLAEQAAIAIRNASIDEELRQTQALAATRTALAWMGMASATALHTIDNKVTTIQDVVALLRRDLKANKPLVELEERLNAISTAAENIRETPISALSSTGTDVERVPLNHLVRERLSQLWQRESHRAIDLRYMLTPESPLIVHANPEWLKRALSIPIDNAVRAMEDALIKTLTVTTHRRDKYAEIHVSDTGPGIPESIKPSLLQAPIKQSTGMGMGLLMAQTIVQAYGGSISLGPTGPDGTTMVIRLPLVDEGPTLEESCGAGPIFTDQ